MISHGDEIGRTQLGNNNVYCQDSELSWMDWSLCRTNADLLTFVRTVTGLRRAHPAFRRRRFFEGKPIRTGDQVRDIAWLTTAGIEMTPEDWNSGFKCVGVFLNGEAIPSPNERGERVLDDSFLLCFNAHSKPVDLVTPDITYAPGVDRRVRHRRPHRCEQCGGQGRRDGVSGAAIGACAAQDGLTVCRFPSCPRIGFNCAARRVVRPSPSPMPKMCWTTLPRWAFRTSTCPRS